MTSVYLFFRSSSPLPAKRITRVFSPNKSHQCGSCCCCCLLLSSYSFNAHFTSRCSGAEAGIGCKLQGVCLCLCLCLCLCVFSRTVYTWTRGREETIIIGDVEGESTIFSGSKEFSSSTSRQEQDRTAAASGGMSTFVLYIHQKRLLRFFFSI